MEIARERGEETSKPARREQIDQSGSFSRMTEYIRQEPVGTAVCAGILLGALTNSLYGSLLGAVAVGFAYRFMVDAED